MTEEGEAALKEAGLALREAVRGDAEAIARLHAESWRTAYRGLYSDEFLDSDVFEDRRRVWLDRMASPPDEMYVLLAVEGPALLGFACSFGREDARWGTLLDNLHVRPDLHRQGIGRQLLVESARWSLERYPEAPFHLWVLEGNSRARAFYDRLGGVPVERSVDEPPGGGSLASWRYAWEDVRGLTAR